MFSFNLIFLRAFSVLLINSQSTDNEGDENSLVELSKSDASPEESESYFVAILKRLVVLDRDRRLKAIFW